MPEFIADTDGVVNGCTWGDLSPFLQGYIEAMLFTNCCTSISMVDWFDPENQERIEEGTADGDIPGDAGYGDIHLDSMIAAHGDCSDFQAKARHLLARAYARDYSETQAGRDFWFTRNRHGVGYWDRTILELDGLGDALSVIAHDSGEVFTYFDKGEESPTGYGWVHIA